MIHVTAKVKDGVVVPYEEILYHNELRDLEGHDIEIKIQSIRLRSTPQNRYYWGTLLYMITNQLIDSGYQATDFGGSAGNLTREVVHESMKATFARQEIYLPETQSVIGSSTMSTTDMSTKEFKNYIDNIRQWAAEKIELDIPDPSHLYSM